MEENNSQIILYQTESGETKLDVTFNDETVWLTQLQLCKLFDKSKATISEHIKHIFEEEELQENVVVRKFRTTTQHGAIAGKTPCCFLRLFKTNYFGQLVSNIEHLQKQ